MRKKKRKGKGVRKERKGEKKQVGGEKPKKKEEEEEEEKFPLQELNGWLTVAFVN